MFWWKPFLPPSILSPFLLKPNSLCAVKPSLRWHCVTVLMLLFFFLNVESEWIRPWAEFFIIYSCGSARFSTPSTSALMSLFCAFLAYLFVWPFFYHSNKHDLFIIWLTWVTTIIFIFLKEKQMHCTTFRGVSKETEEGWIFSKCLGFYIPHRTEGERERNATSIQRHAVRRNYPSPRFARKPSHLDGARVCVRAWLCVGCALREPCV